MLFGIPELLVIKEKKLEFMRNVSPIILIFYFLLDLLGLVTSTWQNLRIQIQSMSVTMDLRTKESYPETGNFGHDKPVSFSIAIFAHLTYENF